MSRPASVLPLLLALGVTLGPALGYAQGQSGNQKPAAITLQSVSIDLPQGDRMFPPGKGADVANANCLACHSVGMVLNQPAMPRAAWETEVHKMINVYKAPIAPADVPTIVAYLDSIKGTKPGQDKPPPR